MDQESLSVTPVQSSAQTEVSVSLQPCKTCIVQKNVEQSVCSDQTLTTTIKQKTSSSEARSIVDQLYQKTEKKWINLVKQEQLEAFTNKNLKSIVEQANKQNPKACFLLGRTYHYGYSVEKDLKQAEFWCQKARGLGQFHSIYNLYYIEKQQKSTRNMELLQEGANMQEMRCVHQLGEQYLKTQGTQEQNKIRSKFMSLIQKFAGSKNCLDKLLNFFIYAKKDSEIFDQQKAFQNLKKYYEAIYENEQMRQLQYGYELFYCKYYSESAQILQQVLQKYQKCLNIQKGQIQFWIGQSYRFLPNPQKQKYWYSQSTRKQYLRSFPKLSSILKKQKQKELERQLLHKGILLQNNIQNDLCKIYSNLADSYIDDDFYDIGYHYNMLAYQLKNQNCGVACAYTIYHGMGVVKDQERAIQLLMEFEKKGNKHAQRLMVEINSQRAKTPLNKKI